MSSKLRIVKVCKSTNRSSLTEDDHQTCSDPYAKRLYKLRQCEKAISRVKVETMVKNEPKAFVTEEQVKVIQVKEWLTLSIVADSSAMDADWEGGGGSMLLRERA